MSWSMISQDSLASIKRERARERVRESERKRKRERDNFSQKGNNGFEMKPGIDRIVEWDGMGGKDSKKMKRK